MDSRCPVVASPKSHVSTQTNNTSVSPLARLKMENQLIGLIQREYRSSKLQKIRADTLGYDPTELVSQSITHSSFYSTYAFQWHNEKAIFAKVNLRTAKIEIVDFIYDFIELQFLFLHCSAQINLCALQNQKLWVSLMDLQFLFLQCTKAHLRIAKREIEDP